MLAGGDFAHAQWRGQEQLERAAAPVLDQAGTYFGGHPELDDEVREEKKRCSRVQVEEKAAKPQSDP
jgi:hypothetical protein